MTPSRLPYNLDHDSRTHLVTLNMLIMVPVNASSSLQNVSVSSSSLEGSRVSTSAAPTEITRGGALNALPRKQLSHFKINIHRKALSHVHNMWLLCTTEGIAYCHRASIIG